MELKLGRSQRDAPMIRTIQKHSTKSRIFEQVYLPDEGREYLKPPLGMFIRELSSIQGEKRTRAICYFWKGDRAFRRSKFREAAISYLNCCKTLDSNCGSMAHAVALMMTSELRRAIEVMETGRNVARVRLEKLLEAAFDINLGQAYNDLGEPDRSRDALTTARRLSHEIGNRSLEAMSLRHLGLTLFVQGSYDEGIKCCERATQISHDDRDALENASTLFVKGVLLMAKGELEQAEDVFLGGIDQLGDLKCSFTEGRIWVQLAYLYLIRGRRQEAKNASENALAIFQRISNAQGEARSWGLLALCHFSDGQPERCPQIFDRALELDRKAGNRRGEIRLQIMRAKLCLQQQQFSDAHVLLRDSDKLAKEVGQIIYQLEAVPLLAIMAGDMPEDERISILKNCLDLSKSANVPTAQIQIHRYLASVHISLGQVNDAVARCNEAVALSQKIGNRLEEAKALATLADVLDAQGHRDLALEQTGIAQAILHSMGVPIQTAERPSVQA